MSEATGRQLLDILEHSYRWCSILLKLLVEAPMSMIEVLQKRVHKDYGKIFATWVPGSEIDVGAYGYLSGGQFFREGSVLDRGIDLYYVEQGVGGNFYTIKGFVEIGAGVGAGGKVAGGVLSGVVEVKFKREGAFLYHLKNAIKQTIDDRQSLFVEIVKKIASGDMVWRNDFVFVDEKIFCGASQVYISKSASGSLSLDAKSPISPDSTTIVDGKLDIKNENDALINYCSERKSDVFYHVVELVNVRLNRKHTLYRFWDYICALHQRHGMPRIDQINLKYYRDDRGEGVTLSIPDFDVSETFAVVDVPQEALFPENVDSDAKMKPTYA